MLRIHWTWRLMNLIVILVFVLSVFIWYHTCIVVCWCFIVLLSPSEKVWKRRSCYRRENAARGRFAQAKTAPLSPQTRRTCKTCVKRATKALAGLCLLAWGDMFRSDEFLHFTINPRLCRLNISDNLCLICSQPANKLINNSLSSGRALKPNTQRASFWKCPFLKTCEPWTSMWAREANRNDDVIYRRFLERFSWRMTQLSGQWLSRRPSHWNTGMFSPTLYAETIHPDAGLGWNILWAWCRLLDLSLCQTVTSSFTSVVFRVCWRGSRQSTCEVE